ncbi:MAG: DUF1080 domain-containing protein [Ginsengibacter sp.]
MKNWITALAGLVIFAGCNTSHKTNSAASTSNATQMNTINSDWVSLFDGKSLDGWRTYQNKESDSWSVMDGVIHCKGSVDDKSDMRADLITNQQFENFELSLDWKLSPQGNSGIIYLFNEDSAASYLTGPEYQLIDDANYPQKLEDWQKTGANYAMNPAPTAAPKPIGEWNNTKILVKDGRVEHWLNDTKIVEYQIGSAEWQANKANGKWKDTSQYGTVKKGYIALQDHGSEAWFRNIKLRML